MIRIDYSNMMGDASGGVAESDWSAAQPRFEAAHAAFQGLRQSGTVGFADIVRDEDDAFSAGMFALG